LVVFKGNVVTNGDGTNALNRKDALAFVDPRQGSIHGAFNRQILKQVGPSDRQLG
jgi:hypothetical protein